jgi:tetratricopeptide (TPR) repeat protein
MVLAASKGQSAPADALQVLETLVADGWVPGGDDAFRMGQLYQAAGDWVRANKLYLRVLGDEQTVRPRHIQQYAQILLKRGDVPDAERWVERLIKARNEDNVTASLLAEVRYRKGQYEQLVNCFLAEDLSISDSEITWFSRATNRRQRFEMLSAMLTRLKNDGKLTELEQFAGYEPQLAKEINVDGEFPIDFFISQLLARGDFAKAVSAVDRYLNGLNQEQLIRFTEFALQVESANPEDVARLEQTLSRVPGAATNPTIQVMRARLQEMRNDYDGSELIYRSLLQANANELAALNNLANLLALRRKSLEEALTMADRALELAGEVPELLDTRAVCKIAAGDLAGARRDLEKAMLTRPAPLFRFHLAWALANAEQITESKAQLEKAIETGLKRGMLHVLERPMLDSLVQSGK